MTIQIGELTKAMNGLVKRLPVKGARGFIDLIEIDGIFSLEAGGDDTLLRTRRRKPNKSAQRGGKIARENNYTLVDNN